MHPRTEVIHSGKVRVLDVTESLTYQGVPVVPGGGGSGTDEKVKVSSDDTTAGYLSDKILADGGIDVAVNNEGGNETITFTLSDAEGYYKSQVSANDNTPGFLNGKLVAGTGITLTEVNDGLNEALSINATGGGVTGFSSVVVSTSPNETTNVSQLSSSAPTTDADVAITPKGSGALYLSVPDGTTANGDKRGSYSVDLQLRRNAASQVASGFSSAVIGGQNNTASSTGSATIGGLSCSATGLYSFATGMSNSATNTSSSVIAGFANQSSGQNSVVSGNANICAATNSAILGSDGSTIQVFRNRSAILGGNSNSISSAGESQVVVGGFLNTVAKEWSGVICGYSNTVAGQASVIVGGNNNSCPGSRSSVLASTNALNMGTRSLVAAGERCTIGALAANTLVTGQRAYGRQVSTVVHSSGMFNLDGDCQSVRYVQRNFTTNDTPTVLNMTMDSSTSAENNISLYSNSMVITFDILVAARRASVSNESAGWRINGVIDSNGGTVAFVGTPTVSVLGDDSGGAWTVQAVADDVNKRLAIQVTGQNSKTIYWSAVAETIQLEC
jgi:hypothetical protein